MTRRLVVERRGEPGLWGAWLAPAAALAMTLLACMLLFAWLGRPPAQVVQVFFVAPLSSLRGWGEVGVKAAPLILCGVGLLVAVPVVLVATSYLYRRLLGEPIAP